MHTVSFTTTGRTWQDDLNVPATLAALDDVPDAVKGGVKSAITGAFSVLDVDGGDLHDEAITVTATIAENAFTLTVSA